MLLEGHIVVFDFWFPEISGNILRIRKEILCLEPFSRQYFSFLDPNLELMSLI